MRPADEARLRAIEAVIGKSEPSPFGLEVHYRAVVMTREEAAALETEPHDRPRFGPAESLTDLYIEVIEVAVAEEEPPA